MRKHVLILSLQLGLAAIILHQTRELILVYYLLAPVLLIPAFYFYKERSRGMLLAALLVVVSVNARYFFLNPMPRLFLFWAGQAVFFALSCAYFRELRTALDYASSKRNQVRKNLENLRAKFQTRISSVKHLEVQVGSLMNLF